MTEQELAVIHQRADALKGCAVWGAELPPDFWVQLTQFLREDVPALLRIAEEAPYP